MKLIIEPNRLPRNKLETTSCGLACTELLLQHLTHRQVNLNESEVFWTTDIGKVLVKEGISACVVAGNSQLLKPFENIKVTTELSIALLLRLENILPIMIRKGYQSLLSFLFIGGVIKRKLISTDIIESAIARNLPVILCVDSQTINNDPSLTGGHFIIVAGSDDYNFGIINPGKNSFHILSINKARLLYACHLWGGWAVFVEENEFVVA
ncbi:hypothetical protein BGP_0815 [Beggiatoa sp. PS]|nr:hypothetical protein BGP_0815 [Beggiatoa sp. PS]